MHGLIRQEIVRCSLQNKWDEERFKRNTIFSKVSGPRIHTRPDIPVVSSHFFKRDDLLNTLITLSIKLFIFFRHIRDIY